MDPLPSPFPQEERIPQARDIQTSLEPLPRSPGFAEAGRCCLPPRYRIDGLGEEAPPPPPPPVSPLWRRGREGPSLAPSQLIGSESYKASSDQEQQFAPPPTDAEEIRPSSLFCHSPLPPFCAIPLLRPPPVSGTQQISLALLSRPPPFDERAARGEKLFNFFLSAPSIHPSPFLCRFVKGRPFSLWSSGLSSPFHLAKRKKREKTETFLANPRCGNVCPG